MTDPTQAPPADAPPPQQGGGQIRMPDNVLSAVILPIALLLALFVAFLFLAPPLTDCNDYSMIKLIYPFLFGGLGVLLGGSVVVDGEVPLFGNKAQMRAAGGIAGAVVGFVIAYASQPSDCEARHSIVLKHFPTSAFVPVAYNGTSMKRHYIGVYNTTSTSVSTTVEHPEEGTRDLKFRFGTSDRSRDGFKIVLSFYRFTLDGTEKLEFARACEIGAEIGVPPVSGMERYKLIASAPMRYEVEFNPNFFNELEEDLKKGTTDAKCLKGRGKLDGNGPPLEMSVAFPLYVTRLTGYFDQELWYVVKAASAPSERTIARRPEAIDGELSVGDKAPPSVSNPPTASPDPANDAPKPARQVAGCAVSDPQRSTLDRFIAGDDLDANQRKDLYKQWSDLHCYVWPLVKNGSTALERARAIKLTVNAIINNSLNPDAPVYWQPAGANKRDFSKSLPFLNDADYKVVFELLKADDLPVRTEATRFVRNLPVDKFAALFNEQADKQETLPNGQRERLAIAASFFHYSRIVEWLDDSDEDTGKAAAAAASAVDFKAASRWLTKPALGDSAKAYEAMLWYAKAIVERERLKNDDAAKASFRQVVEAISATMEPYPSNPLHLAQAIAVSFGGNDPTPVLREIRAADVYSSSTPLAYSAGPPPPPLYIGPADTFKKAPAKTFNSPAGSARMLLRKGEWIFVQYRDQLGWIKRDQVGSIKRGPRLAAQME